MTIAFKVIGVSPTLSMNDMRVAVAIIDHVNQASGRCDPSLNRIADILGVSRRTVIRSMNRLVDQKLFEKVRHGSYNGRNSYYPNWARFRDLDDAYKARGQKRRSRAAAVLSPAQCQSSHLDGAIGVTRTCPANLSH